MPALPRFVLAVLGQKVTTSGRGQAAISQDAETGFREVDRLVDKD